MQYKQIPLISNSTALAIVEMTAGPSLNRFAISMVPLEHRVATMSRRAVLDLWRHCWRMPTHLQCSPSTGSPTHKCHDQSRKNFTAPTRHRRKSKRL